MALYNNLEYSTTLDAENIMLQKMDKSINKDIKEYEGKRQELEEWIAKAKISYENVKKITKLVIPTTLRDDYADVSDDVLNKGLKYAVEGVLHEPSPDLFIQKVWRCEDKGSRWMDYSCPLKYGKGTADVRITMMSRKYNQLPSSVEEEFEFALYFHILYNLELCCLCGRAFVGWGNNPYPCAEKGDCCNDCNRDKVVPARLSVIKFSKKTKEFQEQFPVAYERMVKMDEKEKKRAEARREKDIAEQIQKARKGAEQKAKMEAETERLRAEVKRLKEQKKVETSDAKITITINVSRKGEDDEAKEIRRRAKEVKVKVKTRNGGK